MCLVIFTDNDLACCYVWEWAQRWYRCLYQLAYYHLQLAWVSRYTIVILNGSKCRVMQELSDLLSAVDESYKPTQSCFITDMTCDSRQVISGSLFLAYPGTGQDGRDYILNAIQRGASACLVEARGFNQRQLYTVPVIPVDNLQQKVSKIAVICFNRQGSSLRVMGVTGTNGKTSCAHFYAQLLSLMGGRTAVMGTVGCGRIYLRQI